MNVAVHPSPDRANAAAADLLAEWLVTPGVRNVMVAAGNTPIDLYGRIAERRLNLAQLEIFTLDEYVGVPADEPRSCAGLLRRTVADAWRIPQERFHAIDPHPERALRSVESLERRIRAAGGLDVVILGLGQNGHLGFNEPGSDPDSAARVLPLEPISVEANRKWFGGDYAPAHGVTTGLRTILAARRALILAYGPHKADAVRAMLELPRDQACPASFLQGHPSVHVLLDAASASKLGPSARSLRG